MKTLFGLRLYFADFQNFHAEFPNKLGHTEVFTNVFFWRLPQTLHFMINTELFTGEPIASAAGIEKYFTIELEEVDWNEEHGGCMLYGEGKAFISYADCIEIEHGKVFKRHLGCQVPWLTAPHHAERMCKGVVKTSDFVTYKGKIEKIVKNKVYGMSEKGELSMIIR